MKTEEEIKENLDMLKDDLKYFEQEYEQESRMDKETISNAIYTAGVEISLLEWVLEINE